MGFHFEKIHNNKVFIPRLTSCWHTNAHTPNPVYTNMTPAIPEITAAINDAFAWVLKSILTVSSARWTTASELKIIPRHTTLITKESSGSP